VHAVKWSETYIKSSAVKCLRVWFVCACVVCMYVCVRVQCVCAHYAVATISRLLKIVGLFCRI